MSRLRLENRINILFFFACIFILFSTKRFLLKDGDQAQQDDFIKDSHNLNQHEHTNMPRHNDDGTTSISSNDVGDVWNTPPSDYAKKELTKTLTLNHERKMAFLHVGKTGGATLSELFKVGCFLFNKKCRAERENMPNETEISIQTKDYYHTRRPSPKMAKKFTSYIVSLRDPMDRFVSYYFQAHVANSEYTQTSVSGHTKMFYEECYTDGLDDFVMNGLNPMTAKTKMKVFKRVTKGMNNSTQELMEQLRPEGSIGTTLDEYFAWKHYFETIEKFDPLSCKMYARSLMAGRLAHVLGNNMGGHMSMNIQYYTRKQLFLHVEENEKHGIKTWPEANAKEVFVIRTEHMWDDWQTINTMVGGGKVVIPETSVTHATIPKDKLPIHNRTITPKGMTDHLCCALKEEISYYIFVMYRSSNLEKEDIQTSTDSVFKKCGVSKLGELFDRCESW